MNINTHMDMEKKEHTSTDNLEETILVMKEVIKLIDEEKKYLIKSTILANKEIETLEKSMNDIIMGYHEVCRKIYGLV